MNDLFYLVVYITELVILVVGAIIWCYLHIRNKRGEKILREIYRDRRFLEEHCPRIFHRDSVDERLEEYLDRR